MPMVAGMKVTKIGLLAFVHAVGRAALGKVFEEAAIEEALHERGADDGVASR
jgi:hypothetical protein